MTDRRRGYDPEYTGPDRRNHAQRIKALENTARVLTDQSAEVAVAMSGLDDRMQRAIAAGFREVLTDDELLDDLLDRLRGRMVQGAAEHTGRWLLGTLKAFFSRWVFIIVLVIAIAQYLGPAPAKLVVGWLAGAQK